MITMNNMVLKLIAAAALTYGVTTQAAARDLCPERPGQTTPACTIEPGHAILETNIADWSLQQGTDSRVDTITLGQSALRVGVADHAEIAIGWTPFATVRTRDVTSGLVEHKSGIGDVTVAVKRSFGMVDSPMIAIKAYATLPVGQAPSGLGDWSAGLVAPVSLPLSSAVQFALTPELDAAANSNADGHHLAFGGAAGLGFKLSNTLSLGTDLRVIRDDDPDAKNTKATAGVSLALQHGANLQLDVGTNIGLNANSPDVELYLGISRRF